MSPNSRRLRQRTKLPHEATQLYTVGRPPWGGREKPPDRGLVQSRIAPISWGHFAEIAVLTALFRSLVTSALIVTGVVALFVAWWVIVVAGLVLAAWQGLGRLLGFPGPLEVLLG